jgi:prepilin-type N-terminal cleavage/methylation domain-containing protein
MKISSSERGFTLIELLIVIVIISVLAGIVITVLDPARSKRKAEEAVMLANANKACLALFACAATTDDRADCVSAAGDWAGAGAIAPSKPDATVVTYSIGIDPSNSDTAFVQAEHIDAAGGGCTLRCAFDFGSYTPTDLVRTSADGTCLVEP